MSDGDIPKFACYATERLKYVINNPKYWGVLDIKKNDFIDLFLDIPGDDYWWEFTNPHNGAVVLAITNKQHKLQENIFRHSAVGHLNKRYIEGKIGKYTICIYHNPITYLYHLTELQYFFKSQDKDIYYRYTFDTLKGALECCKNVHNEWHNTNAYDEEYVCNCDSKNRFSYKTNNKIITETWRLQDLSSFFLKNYLVFNNPELFENSIILYQKYKELLPIPCINSISDINAVQKQLLLK